MIKHETKFSVNTSYADGTGSMTNNLKAETASEAIIKSLQDDAKLRLKNTVVSVTAIETTRSDEV